MINRTGFIVQPENKSSLFQKIAQWSLRIGALPRSSYSLTAAPRVYQCFGSRETKNSKTNSKFSQEKISLNLELKISSLWAAVVEIEIW